MAITVTTTTVIVDETTGQQTNGSSGAADTTGNELTFGAGGTPTVPSAFSDALADVAGGLPTTGALSGFSTTATTGVNVIDYGGAAVSGVAFVASNNAPLAGAFSGLLTTDGTKIFLYTYSLNNNVVFGVKGNNNGTPNDPTDDFAVAPEDDIVNQPIVFAAYLEEGATGAKVWLVEYEPLTQLVQGSTAAAYDDAVSASGLFVKVDSLRTFDLTGAPSGQNLFLMYGDAKNTSVAGDEVALVVTAKNAASGGSVNTGQGGGGTTLGSNNQMIDPTEALVFTFVTNANPNFTVSNLDQNEADLEANIDFEGVFGSTTASFKVVQTQPNSKSSTLSISAYTTDAEPRATTSTPANEGFLAGYADDTPVSVVSVTVKNAAGVIIESEGPGTAGINGAAPLDIQFSTVNGVQVATVIGVKSGYTIEYTTSGTHNRVAIENTGVANTKTGAAFDIGGFGLPVTNTTNLPFNVLTFQDDGLAATGTAQTSEVDEDGLTGGNSGGAGDLNAADGINDDGGSEATTSGSIAAIFVAGADGIDSFGLSTDTSGLSTALTSKGGAVKYDVTGGTLTAYVDSGGTPNSLDGTDRLVFTLAVTATGAFNFSLIDQLDHPDTSTEDNLNLQLGSILMATDGDGDTATAAAEKLVITVNDDSPNALSAADISVPNAVDATPGTPTGTAALGSTGKVGADEPGTAKFVGVNGVTGTNGIVLTGDIVGNGINAPENLLADGLPVYLFGFGTSTLTATTSSINADPATNKVFTMTLDAANNVYDITMFKAFANLQDVDFGSFTVAPASGNPLTLVVNNIGGSTVDALFSGFEDTGPSTNPSGSSQTTVNVATVGVGVGTGQDFNFNANGAGTADDVTDRIRIQFLEDDGDGVLESGEAFTINRFTFIMNQNNSPADDGDMLVRVYDASNTELQITGILINGSTLVGSGGAPVASNDGGNVTATSAGLGYILDGLGGGTGGSTADNDTVTIITSAGYQRIDLSGIGADNSKDTYDILLKSLAVPVARDVTFELQAALADFDGDTSAADTFAVTLTGVA